MQTTLELVNGVRIEINHPEALELKEDMVVSRSSTGIASAFEYAAVVRFIAATGTV